MSGALVILAAAALMLGAPALFHTPIRYVAGRHQTPGGRANGYTPGREGDPAMLVADSARARSRLGWSPKPFWPTDDV